MLVNRYNNKIIEIIKGKPNYSKTVLNKIIKSNKGMALHWKLDDYLTKLNTPKDNGIFSNSHYGPIDDRWLEIGEIARREMNK